MQLKYFRGPHCKCLNTQNISIKYKSTIPLEEHIFLPNITRADTDFFSKFTKMTWVQINLFYVLLRVPSVSEIGSSSSPMNCLE